MNYNNLIKTEDLSLNKAVYSVTMVLYALGLIAQVLLLLKIILWSGDDKFYKFGKFVSIGLLSLCIIISISQIVLIGLKKMSKTLFIFNHIAIAIFILTSCAIIILIKKSDSIEIGLIMIIALSVIGYVIAINSCDYFSKNDIEGFAKENIYRYLLIVLYIFCAVCIIIIITSILKATDNKFAIILVAVINAVVIAVVIILVYNQAFQQNAVLFNGIENLSVSSVAAGNVVINTKNRTAKIVKHGTKDIFHIIRNFQTTIPIDGGNKIIQCDAPLPYDPVKYRNITMSYISEADPSICYNINSFYDNDIEVYKVINRVIICDSNPEIIKQIVIIPQEVVITYDFVYNRSTAVDYNEDLVNQMSNYDKDEFIYNGDTLFVLNQQHSVTKMFNIDNDMCYIINKYEQNGNLKIDIYDLKDNIVINLSQNKLESYAPLINLPDYLW